jgi:hypothetical protein
MTFEDYPSVRVGSSDVGNAERVLGVGCPYSTGRSVDELDVVEGTSSAAAQHWNTLRSIVQVGVNVPDGCDLVRRSGFSTAAGGWYVSSAIRC